MLVIAQHLFAGGAWLALGSEAKTALAALLVGIVVGRKRLT